MTLASSNPDESRQGRAIRSFPMSKALYAFAVLAVLSFAISAGGRLLGRSLALAGHTDDISVYEIVIGNDVIAAPASAIRFADARRDGAAARLDLYLHWPDLEGYSQFRRNEFNHAGGSRRIVFLTFEKRMMSHDMSGRFRPVYSSLVTKPGLAGPAGTTLFSFDEKSAFANEILAVAAQSGGEPFVARCLSGPLAEGSIAPCERDIHVGEGLSLTYRFPRELLPDWRNLDRAIRRKAAEMLTPPQKAARAGAGQRSMSRIAIEKL